MNIINLLNVSVTPNNHVKNNVSGTDDVKSSKNFFEKLNVQNNHDGNKKSHISRESKTTNNYHDKVHGLKKHLENEKTSKLTNDKDENLMVETSELKSILKEVANEHMKENSTSTIISEEQIESFVELSQELSMLLQHIQHLQAEKGLETADVDKLLSEISNLGLQGNFKSDLKYLEKLLSEIKTPLMDIRKIETKDLAMIENINNLTSKVSELETLFMEISDSNQIKIETEVVQLLSSNKLNSNDDSKSEEKSLDVNLNIENNFTMKNESSGVEKNSGVNRQNEMNLEQLRQKVNDRLEQIQKMTSTKEKLLIQLNPKNLGNVEILFKKTSDGIEITTETEEKNTKHHIESMFDDVKKEMKEKNIEFNFIYKEKQNEQGNSERKKENQDEYRKVENAEGESFEEILERVMRGE